MKRSLLLFICFVFACYLKAQIYPVQVITQLSPPYSGYLPDYADPGSEKLKVILQFNDFTVSQYKLRLRFEIKGNGFTMVTKALYNPAPITVEPGQPLLLSGSDLAAYLSSANLDITGFNQAAYEQRMALPEGYYSICVKAYDYYLPGNIQVSNEACANAWFTYSNPPFLNLPFCNSVVNVLDPQNVVFQWTPVNLGSPNSAFNTYYDFMLYEMRPDSNVNANQLVMSVQPIFSVTTQQTFLNYGITEPPLNQYMKYVWRVRVRDISGRDWFINDGYSQICMFTYGTARSVLGATSTLSLGCQAVSHRLGRAVWNLQSAFSSYLLQVRKQNTNNWFDYPTSENNEKIPNLEPNTTYEARVRGEGTFTGDWSNVETFTTPPPQNYTCNDQNVIPDILPAKPLPVSKAITGLVIQSGQFEILAQTMVPKGQPGWYSGTGKALVFGALPVDVKWDNIYIDDNNRHQQGVIEALTKGIDNWLQQWDLTNAQSNAHYVNGKIDSVYTSGDKVCYVLDGGSDAICIPTPTGTNMFVLRDDDGNEYRIQLVPPPPKVTGPFGYLAYSDDALAANDSLKVIFEEYVQQKFGFDKKEHAAFIDNYEVIKLSNGKNYFVPNKSIGESDNDGVLASFTITGNSNPQITFKTKSGTAITSTSENGKFRLSGIPSNAECIYAYYDNKKIGKLNVVSLKPLGKKLVLVSVNGANVNLTASELNDIYKQANVTWTVSTISNFTFNLGSDGLEAADASLLSKYSNEMRAMRDAYKAKDTAYDKSAYFIFVVSNFTDQNLKGYMVRGRALGFVRSDATAKDIAHELAHGAFGLEHTFPKAERESTFNLLDYKDEGKKLIKPQWSTIQDPGIIMSWGDEEEDAALLGKTSCSIDSLPKTPVEIRQFFTKAYSYQEGLSDEFAKFVFEYGYTVRNHLAFYCLGTRVRLINSLLSGNNVSREDEEAIFALLESTPEKDVAGLSAYLSCQNYELYLKLENEFNDAGIGEKSYTKLVKILCDLLGRNFSAVAVDNIIKNDLVFEFKENSLVSITNFKSDDCFTTETKGNSESYHRTSYTYKFTKTSETKLLLNEHKKVSTYTDGGGVGFVCSPCDNEYIIKGKEYNLFDLIAVIPKNAPSYNDYTFPDGEMRVLPALYFKWLQKKNFNQQIEDVGYGVAGAVSMYVGAGELMLAVRAGKALKLIVPAGEVIFGATTVADAASDGGFSIFLQQNLSPNQFKAFKTVEASINVLSLYKAGRANFKALNTKLVSISEDFYSKLKTTPQFFKDLKSKFPEKYAKMKDYFQKAIGKNIDEVGNGAYDLAEAFINGWSKEKILALPKGSRPPPAEYLKSEYITSHLSKFEKEGVVSRLVLKKDYETFGVGKPDIGKTEFVSTKSEIDEILKLPISEQAKKLGIPIEQLGGGNVVRIDFKLSGKYKVEMPSGNEFGTNKQWLPGGKLPDGNLEAIIKTEGMTEGIDFFVKTFK